jgi:hypothetical protein
MKRVQNTGLVRQNTGVAKNLYAGIQKQHLAVLRELTKTLKLSIRRGELLLH